MNDLDYMNFTSKETASQEVRNYIEKKFNVSIFEANQKTLEIVKYIENSNNPKKISKNKPKIQKHLESIFENVKENKAKEKIAYFFSTNNYYYLSSSLVIIKKEEGFVFFSSRIPRYKIFDNEMNFIHETIINNNKKTSVITSKNFKISPKESFKIYINNNKSDKNYVYKDALSKKEEVYLFEMYGSYKIKQVELKKDEIHVFYTYSKYSKIIFDYNYNMKYVELAYSYYNKYREFISNRKMVASNLSEVEKRLEDMFEMYQMVHDKKPDFITQEAYDKQIEILKKIVENRELFLVDQSLFDSLIKESLIVSKIKNEVEDIIKNKIVIHDKKIKTFTLKNHINSELNIISFISLLKENNLNLLSQEKMSTIQDYNNKFKQIAIT